MNPTFVHLKLHSEYSLVDGIVKIKPLIKQCVDKQFPAVAITDQNNFFGLVKFYRAALQAGIKPIIGADIWLKDDVDDKEIYRLTLLSESNQGYKNITSIISKLIYGQHQGLPVVERSWLKTYAQGVIVLLGGFLGDVGRALLTNNQMLVQERLDLWQTYFNDRYYLEISRTGRSNEEDYLHAVVPLASQTQIPIATNDVRFLESEDFDAHEAQCALTKGVYLFILNAQKTIHLNRVLELPKWKSYFQIFLQLFKIR